MGKLPSLTVIQLSQMIFSELVGSLLNFDQAQNFFKICQPNSINDIPDLNLVNYNPLLTITFIVFVLLISLKVYLTISFSSPFIFFVIQIYRLQHP